MLQEPHSKLSKVSQTFHSHVESFEQSQGGLTAKKLKNIYLLQVKHLYDFLKKIPKKKFVWKTTSMFVKDNFLLSLEKLTKGEVTDVVYESLVICKVIHRLNLDWEGSKGDRQSRKNEGWWSYRNLEKKVCKYEFCLLKIKWLSRLSNRALKKSAEFFLDLNLTCGEQPLKPVPLSGTSLITSSHIL